MTDEANYRLQIRSSASQVFFSYLPVDAELQVTNPLDNAKQPEPPAPEPTVEEKPAESAAGAVKRPLETTAEEKGKEEEAAKKDDMVVEPEQKKMKTDEEVPKPSEDKPEVK